MEVAGRAGALMPGAAMVNAVSALNKSMGTKAMAEVTRSADQMVASAKSGGFKVTPEAADPIIEVLEKYIDEVNSMDRKLVIFEQAPPLGGHDYGLLVAGHIQEAANGDRSPRAALKQLRIVLERSRDALRTASGRYQEQDELVRDSFSGMGTGEV
jgi:hypothetical protein